MSVIHPRSLRTLLAIAISIALLYASVLGLRHRVQHGVPVAQAYACAAGDEPCDRVQHSCAAFDAATLGDPLSVAGLLPSPMRQRCPAGAITRLQSPMLPFRAHYGSRAPPADRADSVTRFAAGASAPAMASI